MATECADELETLHQFTGQCWSDSGLVFLWFAGGIGETIQEELENPKFLNDFYKFYKLDITHKNLRYYYSTLLSHTAYDDFVLGLYSYAEEMLSRYKNWKHPPEGPGAITLRRTTSCLLSTKISINGMFLGDMLVKNPNLKKEKVNKNSILKIYEELEKINLQKYKNKTQSQAVLELRKNTKEITENEETLGYSSFNFSNVIFVLLKFFFRKFYPGFHSDFITNTFDQDTPDVVQTPYFIRNIIKRNNILQRLVTHKTSAPFFDINIYPFITTNKEECMVYQKIPEDVAYSCIVSCDFLEGGSVDTSSGGHAIALLTCSNLETFLYDDNDGKLVQVPWPKIFDTMRYFLNQSPEAPVAQAYILYPKTMEGIKNRINIVKNKRDLYNKLREDILAGNETARPKLEEYLKQEKAEGRDFGYTDIYTEKTMYDEEEVKGLNINGDTRKIYEERIAYQKEKIKENLLVSEFLRLFNLFDNEEYFTNSYIHTIIEFKPIFCLADYTNNKFILFNKQEEVFVVETKIQELDMFTIFFFTLYQKDIANFLTFVCEELYKIKYINSMCAFVKPDAMKDISKDISTHNLHTYFRDELTRDLLDTHKNDPQENDPYGGGARKKRKQGTRKHKRRSRKTRKC